MSEDLKDHHSNLLLPCSEHHKQIDDQINAFTVDRLQKIKSAHRDWISRLGEPGAGPARWVADPSFSQPRTLKVITTGNALFRLLADVGAFEYGFADHLSDEDEELIIEFLDLLKDYMDIVPDLHSVREQREVAKVFGRYISRLAEAGFLVGAWVRRLLLTGGGHQEPWPVACLRVEVHRGTDAEFDIPI